MKVKKTVYGIIAVLMIAAFILVAFYLINGKKSKENAVAEEQVDVTALTEILLQDIEKTYPPTPKELLKYYSEITCCFYNQDLNEEQLKDLAVRARELYDEDLVSSVTEEEYVQALKEDILSFKSQNIVISGYSLCASTDVEYFSQDGYDCARLFATYRLRQGTEYVYSEETFIMRKDGDNHWKIYGWVLDEDEDKKQIDGESAPLMMIMPLVRADGEFGGIDE